MVTYEFRSNVVIDIHETQYLNEITDRYSLYDLTYTELSLLRDKIQNYGNELVDHLNNYLKDVITSILVDIDSDKKEAVAIVKSNRELDLEEIENLKDYIESQYSDGWGEALEQECFHRFEDEVEIYNEDDDDYDIERTDYEMYARFWNTEDFKMRVFKRK